MPLVSDVSEELVLVVDDNSTVRAKVIRALGRAHCQTLEAASIRQARAMLRAPLSAIVVAETLPDGTAVELLANLTIPSIILTSGQDSESAIRAVAFGARASVDRSDVAD